MDTATSCTAVALRLSDGSTIERRDEPPPGAHPGHATRLLTMAGEVLDEAGVGWSQIERIAAGVGPGTFTGLRVGIATARGLAQSLLVPLAPVSSLRALAQGALAAGAARVPHDAVVAVIDARRGEIFVAGYASDGHELSGPRAIGPPALGAALAAGSSGAGVERWEGVGDGAVRYREHLEEAGVEVPADASALHRVSASVICELAASAGGMPVSYQHVRPDYLRRPDAEDSLKAAARP